MISNEEGVRYCYARRDKAQGALVHTEKVYVNEANLLYLGVKKEFETCYCTVSLGPALYSHEDVWGDILPVVTRMGSCARPRFLAENHDTVEWFTIKFPGATIPGWFITFFDAKMRYVSIPLLIRGVVTSFDTDLAKGRNGVVQINSQFWSKRRPQQDLRFKTGHFPDNVINMWEEVVKQKGRLCFEKWRNEQTKGAVSTFREFVSTQKKFLQQNTWCPRMSKYDSLLSRIMEMEQELEDSEKRGVKRANQEVNQSSRKRSRKANDDML